MMGGDVAQLAEYRTGTPPAQVRFPGTARNFSPRVNFPCRLSYGVRTPTSAIACVYICAHVKDPVVHVRVRWIMETLKHPACIQGWVALLCRSWLPPGKANRIFHGRNPIGTIYSCTTVDSSSVLDNTAETSPLVFGGAAKPD